MTEEFRDYFKILSVQSLCRRRSRESSALRLCFPLTKTQAPFLSTMKEIAIHSDNQKRNEWSSTTIPC